MCAGVSVSVCRLVSGFVWIYCVWMIHIEWLVYVSAYCLFHVGAPTWALTCFPVLLFLRVYAGGAIHVYRYNAEGTRIEVSTTVCFYALLPAPV